MAELSAYTQRHYVLKLHTGLCKVFVLDAQESREIVKMQAFCDLFFGPIHLLGCSDRGLAVVVDSFGEGDKCFDASV